MKTVLLIFLLSAFTTTHAFSQEYEPGFYLTQNKQEKCEREIKSLVKKGTYCITPRPIVSTAEFLYVSEVQRDTVARYQYMDLRVSENALASIKTSMEMLPDSRMVLVVNNKAAGVFTKEFARANLKYIRISDIATSTEIIQLYLSLRQLVKYQSEEAMRAAQEKKE